METANIMAQFKLAPVFVNIQVGDAKQKVATIEELTTLLQSGTISVEQFSKSYKALTKESKVSAMAANYETQKNIFAVHFDKNVKRIGMETVGTVEKRLNKAVSEEWKKERSLSKVLIWINSNSAAVDVCALLANKHSIDVRKLVSSPRDFVDFVNSKNPSLLTHIVNVKTYEDKVITIEGVETIEKVEIITPTVKPIESFSASRIFSILNKCMK